MPSVPTASPVPGALADDTPDAGAWSRRRPLDDDAEMDAGADRRRAMAGSFAGTAPGGRTINATAKAATVASSAFLAQQIFQEAMTSGLHLEPWTQGIGAYRRAGAAPPLATGAPTLFSVAV